MSDMRRREFITLLGSAVAWPLAARAQQPVVPTIGVLNGQSADTYAQFVAWFRQGLNETGYVEGSNVAIEQRWADGHYDRLPALADELLRRRVAVIFALGGTEVAAAAKAATLTIPVVFTTGSDPVKSGLVASLSRPGGNVTGTSFYTVGLAAKRLELLHELVPKANLIGVLVQQGGMIAEEQSTDLQRAARAIGLQVRVIAVSNDRDIELALAKLVQEGAGALFVTAGAFFTSRLDKIAALAARHSIPAMYARREGPAAGGLVSYAADVARIYRRAGEYTGRILKGAKPGDLPVELPTKFELVINLKTAKVLGLTVPLTLHAAADEVIE
jgi:putative tryptophan/tyrosine transport system substrate-binding protein